LTLLEKYFTKYPEDADKVVLSIKGGAGPNLAPDGSPENIRRSVDNCLKLLNGKKKLDIFECARGTNINPLDISLDGTDVFATLPGPAAEPPLTRNFSG
jgi:pyridoxine 4-dehydrogenase